MIIKLYQASKLTSKGWRVAGFEASNDWVNMSAPIIAHLVLHEKLHTALAKLQRELYKVELVATSEK